MEPNNPAAPPVRVCGNRYRTLEGREFICKLEDHPRRPDNHYYERDLSGVSPARLESDLEDYFRRSVAKAGGAAFKLVATRAGMPDRLVLLAKGVHLVELKALGGSLRPDQRVWHAKAAALGVEVVVLTGRAEVDAWIAEVLAAAKVKQS